jgi:hypothetical protein
VRGTNYSVAINVQNRHTPHSFLCNINKDSYPAGVANSHKPFVFLTLFGRGCRESGAKYTTLGHHIGMSYIEQPRGQGTAYRFRMKTPATLVGREDPQTGKPFGTWIIRSLGGERHLPTAKKLRDMRLAEVRTIEAEYRASEAAYNALREERERWKLAD